MDNGKDKEKRKFPLIKREKPIKVDNWPTKKPVETPVKVPEKVEVAVR